MPPPPGASRRAPGWCAAEPPDALGSHRGFRPPLPTLLLPSTSAACGPRARGASTGRCCCGGGGCGGAPGAGARACLPLAGAAARAGGRHSLPRRWCVSAVPSAPGEGPGRLEGAAGDAPAAAGVALEGARPWSSRSLRAGDAADAPAVSGGGEAAAPTWGESPTTAAAGASEVAPARAARIAGRLRRSSSRARCRWLNRPAPGPAWATPAACTAPSGTARCWPPAPPPEEDACCRAAATGAATGATCGAVALCCRGGAGPVADPPAGSPDAGGLDSTGGAQLLALGTLSSSAAAAEGQGAPMPSMAMPSSTPVRSTMSITWRARKRACGPGAAPGVGLWPFVQRAAAPTAGSTAEAWSRLGAHLVAALDLVQQLGALALVARHAHFQGLHLHVATGGEKRVRRSLESSWQTRRG